GHHISDPDAGAKFRSIIIFVPVLVARPAAAAQARSPAPAVIAARTSSAGFKSVPHRAAAVIEKLGRVAVGAKPAAGRIGLPPAQRTADALKAGFFLFGFHSFNDLFGLESFLKRREERESEDRCY